MRDDGREAGAESHATADRPRIALLAKLPQDLRDALAARYELVEHDPSGPPQPDLRLAVTTSMEGADERAMASLPALGFIGCQGVGLDRIDLPAAARRGIAVAHTPDILTEDVADFAIALMYGVVRRVAEADRFVRNGEWKQGRMAPSVRLHGKRAGVLGLGRIGSAIARRASALGMDVAYTNPSERPGSPFERVRDLVSLARRSDVLFLSSPGGTGTTHLVNSAVLGALGPRGFLVNIARGSVVDEAALIQALQQGGIAGAGLDVFASEPALDERFLSLDNVVLAPHYASITVETRRDMIGMVLQKLEAWLTGRPFLNAASGA